MANGLEQKIDALAAQFATHAEDRSAGTIATLAYNDVNLVIRPALEALEKRVAELEAALGRVGVGRK